MYEKLTKKKKVYRCFKSNIVFSAQIKICVVLYKLNI